jgi:predicted NUDIX family phosphoesterase
MGFINDDLSEVGSVHLGLVFCAQAVSKTFNVVEKDKMRCEWVSKEAIAQQYDKLESWSQILYSALIVNQEHKTV